MDIRTYFRQTSYECWEWDELAQDTAMWQASVNILMNHWVP